ncbi:FMN-binding protein [Cellulomonas sp. McL0617]|uniref:FMN-binding protein n=1 Tax=Cellulomonas sp. McL0617 TaxID=3415675 RepID=UPI003CF1B5EA
MAPTASAPVPTTPAATSTTPAAPVAPAPVPSTPAAEGQAGSGTTSTQVTAPPAVPTIAAPPEGPVTVTGEQVNTPYGPLQVAVTFTGTSISSVKVLQSPSSRALSVQINAHALPILIQEAVTAGSANIDAVSGATYTSAGYKKSLQFAIDHRG